MNFQQLRSSIATLLALCTISCGDAPRPVQPAGATPHAPHPGHEEHAAHAQGAWRGFAGRAVLKGELAQAETGSLMISVYPRGTRMPALTTKIALDDPRVRRNEAGERVLSFELDESTSMIPGEAPEGVELDLEVRYDRDGFVETKEGDVVAMVPARPGDRDLELVLPPEHGTVPAPAESGD